MKKSDFLKMLQDIPDDAEIFMDVGGFDQTEVAEFSIDKWALWRGSLGITADSRNDGPRIDGYVINSKTATARRPQYEMPIRFVETWAPALRGG